MISKHEFESTANLLLLNPRWPKDDRFRFEEAWIDLVERKFESHVGIATSGSTGGTGSLILLSKMALQASARAVNERLVAGAGDVWFKTLPDFHVGGLGILVRAWLSDSRVVEDTSEKWDPLAFHWAVESSHATLTSLVPTQLFDLVRLDLPSPFKLRAVVIGGGRLEESLRVRALELGWPVLPSYGMTEACSQVATAVTPDDPRLVPLSHLDVDVDHDGKFKVSGPSLLSAKIVFEANGAKLVDPKRSGWFTTEDRGRIEDDGSLVIEGRDQDFVKIGGEGVLVSRLEEKLESVKLSVGFTGDAALLAVKDDRLGAKIVLLTTKDDIETKKLRDGFDTGVAPYEKIRSVHVVNAIPRTELGKLQRVKALALVGLEPATNG